mgnify:CR=1 FL=1
MPLVGTKEMFKKAYEGGFAIGAFNINNMEIVQGITEAAAELNSPVILQASAGARKYAKGPYLRHLVEAALEVNDIPIALHLDHGPDFETCKSCIDDGFTSVMFDGSHYDFKENIKRTKEVVAYAHEHNVVVEAELGKLAGIEDDVKVAAHEAAYTQPEEVEEFVRETGVDSLAIAIGTSMVRSSSNRNSARATLTASSYRLNCVSISSLRSRRRFLSSRSSCTVLPPLSRSTSRSSTTTVASSTMLSASRKISSARLQNPQSARSTSTPICVSL